MTARAAAGDFGRRPPLPTDLSGLRPGTNRSFALAVPEFGGGCELSVPVDVLTGGRRGKRVVLIAGVHGDEPEGILALRELRTELDPAKLRGQVVIVAIANPPAFAAGRRTSPLDGMDLNRAFPGRSDGSATERLADALFRRVVAGADFLFSLHSWFAHGATLPFVEVNAVQSAAAAASLRAAATSGFCRIRLVDWPAGLLVRVANEHGVPGIEAEIGGSGISLPRNRALYKAHIRRVLRHLRMIEFRPPPAPQPRFYRGRHVLSPAGGVLHQHAPLGRRVRAGDVIAAIERLDGGAPVVIRAPAAGIVATQRTFSSATPGDNVATIFSAAARPKES